MSEVIVVDFKNKVRAMDISTVDNGPRAENPFLKLVQSQINPMEKSKTFYFNKNSEGLFVYENLEFSLMQLSEVVHHYKAKENHSAHTGSDMNFNHQFVLYISWL